MCCKGWDYATAAREVEKIVGDAPSTPAAERKDPRPRLNNLRTRAEPAGKAVQSYLAGRGLICPPSLQQVRDRYYTGKDQWSGEFDAMLARVVGPDGKPQSYHVTYLLDGHKAPVESPRKLMTPVDTTNGAAVRLFPLAAHLGIAEGIESAIAAHMLYGIPVWSVLNKNGIETFVPPPGVEQLTIFADNDASYVGQAAAYACARRMVAKPLAIACDVQVPPGTDTDWNDVLLTRAGRAAA
jgi:putative DNA primase/helicase